MTACTYPDCDCPFDPPADPAWCCKGLPRVHTVPTVPGLTFTHLPANLDFQKWQCEGEGIASYGYTPETAHQQWEHDFQSNWRIQHAAKRITDAPGDKVDGQL